MLFPNVHKLFFTPFLTPVLVKNFIQQITIYHRHSFFLCSYGNLFELFVNLG